MTSLKVNNEDHVTIRLTEEEAIVINCTTRGRPAPHVVLIKDGAIIASKLQGSYDFDDVVFLTTLTSSAGCDDTGQYTCQAGNGIGQSANLTVWIFVDCKYSKLFDSVAKDEQLSGNKIFPSNYYNS